MLTFFISVGRVFKTIKVIVNAGLDLCMSYGKKKKRLSSECLSYQSGYPQQSEVKKIKERADDR